MTDNKEASCPHCGHLYVNVAKHIDRQHSTPQPNLDFLDEIMVKSMGNTGWNGFIEAEVYQEARGEIGKLVEQVELEARIDEIYKCRDTLALSTHDHNRLIDRVAQLKARLTQKGESDERN